ncbi:MAG TPA: penicillin-binding transpeptidase domain-containing protein [Thermoanaerobaculia bacterium]|nr:penicillin-binding transpeptidase domain-containing protein [Thermoanaerobaculia bacterium]
MSEKPARRRLPLRWLAVLLVTLIGGIAVLVYIVTGFALHDAARAWRNGHPAEAAIIAENGARWFIRSSDYDQLLAIAYSTAKKPELAAPHLENLARGGRIWFPVIPKSEVAQRLIAFGRYAEFLAYDQAVQERNEGPAVPLYRSAALASIGRISDAEAAFRDVDPGKVGARQYGRLREALVQRKRGAFPYVLDREGHTIAEYRFANSNVVAMDAAFAQMIDKGDGTLTIESQLASLTANDNIETTMDRVVQGAALAALGGFRGSIVAIDPRTNEILAIASAPGRGPNANLAIEQQYDPGSIVKVLTALNGLESGVDVRSIFPYHCQGSLNIDGQRLADELPLGHGALPDLDEALAVSCNGAFADLGLRIGATRLQSFMTAAGFNRQINIGLASVPLGKSAGTMPNRYETAAYAAGMQHQTVTALHVAMLAAMTANRGVLTAPRLLRARRSILGDVVAGPPPQSSSRVASAEHAEAIVRAMERVVSSPNGTGRRAAIDGFKVAMQTGTVSGPAGISSVIMAFAPADRPRIAFGLIAEDAGPAEYAGAKIARDFLVAVEGRR